MERELDEGLVLNPDECKPEKAIRSLTQAAVYDPLGLLKLKRLLLLNMA